MREGWNTRKLGDICTIKGRIGFRGYTREDLVDAGEGAITLSPSNIIDDKLSLAKCQYISWFKYEQSPEIKIFNGDIIFAKTASIGKVAIVDNLPEKATINPQFVVMKKIKENNRFLYYALRSRPFKFQLSQIINGVAIPTVSQSNLEKLSIPVPPIAEQEMIVAELDCLTGIIDKKKQQLEELDILTQSIFYDMFGDPIANEKGWEMKKLGDVATVLDSKRKPITKSDRKAGVYPYYGATGIQDYVEGFIFDGRYLLLGEDGARWGAGDKSAFIIEGKSWVNNHAHVLQIGNGAKDVYIQYHLNICDLLQYITGAIVPKLTQASMVRIPIMLPPLDLQNEFAQKIEAIEKQKELVKRSIVETETLFNSRMDYWFNY